MSDKTERSATVKTDRSSSRKQEDIRNATSGDWLTGATTEVHIDLPSEDDPSFGNATAATAVLLRAEDYRQTAQAAQSEAFDGSARVTVRGGEESGAP